MSNENAATSSNEPASTASKDEDNVNVALANNSPAQTSAYPDETRIVDGSRNELIGPSSNDKSGVDVGVTTRAYTSGQTSNLTKITPPKPLSTEASPRTSSPSGNSGSAVSSATILTANKIFKRQISSSSSSLPTTPVTTKKAALDIAAAADQDVKINLPKLLSLNTASATHSKPPPIPTPPTSVPPSPIPSPKSTISLPSSSSQQLQQGQLSQPRLIAPRLLSTSQNNRPSKPISRASSRASVGGSTISSDGGVEIGSLLDNTTTKPSHRSISSDIPNVSLLSTINVSNSNNSSMTNMSYSHDDSRDRMPAGNSAKGTRPKNDRCHPALAKVFQMDEKDYLPLLPTPRTPPKCPLFCCFYAYFDNKVGPAIGYQSPKRFMDNDIGISTEKVHDILGKTFSKYTATTNKSSKKQRKQKQEKGINSKTLEDTTDETGGANASKEDNMGPNETSTTTTEHTDSQTEGGANNSEPSSDVDYQVSDGQQEKAEFGADSNDGDDERDDDDEDDETDSIEDDSSVELPEGAISIFDSTSEYIITGHELCDKTITLSTHGMHILTRPTVIHHERYARNALLFSVGFVLRRAADPSPFRPLLAKWASTLRSMEVESNILSNPKLQPQLQIILERILISLNSPSWECNLLLSPSNALNLKLFHPPKPLATAVNDHDVPILLRRDLQLQMYDWDLAINWVILHIDGVTNARLISLKAEVDLELVRACLRVLKHHGVIALVDMFLYTNRYEFTSRASAMLAGNEPKLLQEAVDFCIKSSRSVAPPGFQMTTSGSWGAGGGGGSPSGMMGPLIGGTISGGSGGGGAGGSQSDSSAAVPHGQQQSLPHGASPFNTLMSSQQQQQQHQGTPASYNFLGPSSHHRSSGFKFAMLAAQSLERDSTLLSMPRSKEEYRNLKLAIAELYGACNRNLSFGDLWVALTAPDVTSSRASNGNGHNDEASPSLALPMLRNTSSNKTSGSDSSSVNIQRQGSRRINMIPRSSNSDVGSDPPDPLESLAISPLETMHLDALRSRASGATSIDWETAFHRFDHRRFASFGVVHGLLVRVHNYPYFAGIFPEDEANFCDASSVKTPVVRNNAHEEDAANSSGSPMIPPDLKPQRRSSLGMRNEHDVKASFLLARKVASLMDGTRCDDELVCQFEKPFKELVELVEKYGKQKVVSVYATAPGFQ